MLLLLKKYYPNSKILFEFTANQVNNEIFYIKQSTDRQQSKLKFKWHPVLSYDQSLKSRAHQEVSLKFITVNKSEFLVFRHVFSGIELLNFKYISVINWYFF